MARQGSRRKPPPPTIALDTNLFDETLNLRTTWVSMLQQVAKARNLRLALPEMVEEELLAWYGRRLHAELRQVAKAVGAISRMAEAPISTEPVLDFDLEIENKRARLRTVFEVLPMPLSAGREALIREARRQLPCKRHPEVEDDKSKPGGARDAAIWLTLLDLANTGQEIIFVSENTKDFGGDGLHGELRRELQYPDRFTYVTKISDVLGLFGQAKDPIDIGLLLAQPKATQRSSVDFTTA
jgi:hypothetical protein